MNGEIIDIQTPATQGNFFGYTCVANLVSNLASLALTAGGIIFFVLLVWGGLEWLTSGGDKGKTETAQKRISSALIGLVILVTSWALYQLVLSVLGINMTDLCSENPTGI